jgi:thiopurine S-methyltransferase
MDSAFWHSRWGAGQIGFHEGQPNAHLVKHHAVLGAGTRVFVPLCGKTEDLAYLAAQGHEVVGVELVESAVVAFFAEHGVTPEAKKDGVFTRYSANGISILAGDFFAVTPEKLGAIGALYDRAAVIALPAEMRADYVEHVRALMPHDAPGLIITVEYEQSRVEGPPFSVSESELRAHYAGLSLERVEDVAAGGPRLVAAAAREKAYVAKF